MKGAILKLKASYVQKLKEEVREIILQYGVDYECYSSELRFEDVHREVLEKLDIKGKFKDLIIQ